MDVPRTTLNLPDSSATDAVANEAGSTNLPSALVNISAKIGQPLVDAVNSTLSNATEWASVNAPNGTAKGGKKHKHSKTHEQPTMQSNKWQADSSPATTAFAYGDRQGRTSLLSLSLIHFLGWVLLFATLTMATVVAMNWYMRRRQAAEELNEEEALHAQQQQHQAPGGATTQPLLATSGATTAVDVTASSGPSQTSLRGDGGNSSRQRFLEARRAAAQKGYGATEAPEPL